jgi:DNA repair protein RadC
MKNLEISTVNEVCLKYKTKVKSSELPKINGSCDCVNIFRSIETYNNNIDIYECFYCMYLSKANKVLSVMLISEGGISGTVVDLKKILAPAILQHASGIIISHNHPSGNLNPSQPDIDMTKKIKEAAKLIDVQLFDHIILTSEEYLSFSDEGLI